MLLPGVGLVGLAIFALWIYCIFDVISTDDSLIRNLPKTMWLIIVIFLPTVGSISWLLLGRPLYAGWRPGDTTRRPAPQARGPEDDAGWRPAAGSTGGGSSPTSREERLRDWERDLDRRENELRNPSEPTSSEGHDEPDEGEGQRPAADDG